MARPRAKCRLPTTERNRHEDQMRVSYQVPRTCPRAGGSAFAFFFTWGFRYWHWVLFLQAKYAYSSTDTRICSKFKFMFEESPMRPRYPRVPGCTRLVVPNICSCRVLEKLPALPVRTRTAVTARRGRDVVHEIS